MVNELPRIVIMNRGGARRWQSRPGSGCSVSNNVFLRRDAAATLMVHEEHFRRMGDERRGGG